MPVQESNISDRRPIAARGWRISTLLRDACVWLHLSPNQVSVLGMLCGVGAGACLALTQREGSSRFLWVAGAVLILARLTANMLDGMVAVATGTTSPLGELYNDVPDRVSDTSVLVGLGFAHGGNVDLGLLAALLAMMTAYIRAVGKAAGAGSDFRGPMAKQQRMVCVILLALFQTLAGSEADIAWGPGKQWGLAGAVLALIAAGSLVTCVRRLAGVAARLRNNAT